MPIPDFDHNYVIPPHLGMPTNRTQVSPYVANSVEFIDKFATSVQRIKILEGFLNFRKELRSVGISEGWQWVDGSFCENIEIAEKRPPNDLDIITISSFTEGEELEQLVTNSSHLFEPSEVKKNYSLDHYWIDINHNNYNEPMVLVDTVRYWIQLFCHNRKGVWKGMISIPLNSEQEDNIAMRTLQLLKENEQQ